MPCWDCQSSVRTPTSVATQGATGLGPRCSRSAVRGDQFHATTGQIGIQAVRLVGVVTDETYREPLDKPLRESCVYQGNFVRRGTLDVNRERESAAIGDRHDLRALSALRLAHAGASLLRWCEAPIDEGFLQIHKPSSWRAWARTSRTPRSTPARTHC